MKTVTEARRALEIAQSDYIAADIYHPTQVSIAKEALTNARHEFWNTCAHFVTKLEFKTDMFEVQDELIAQGIWK